MVSRFFLTSLSLMLFVFSHVRSGRDVNKATDSKAKAEAEAEASVPWHKLVIMHNFLKPSCKTLNLSVSDASV